MARPVVPLRAEGRAQHAGDQPVPQLPDAATSSRPAAQHRRRSRSAACWCRIRSTARSRRPTPTAAQHAARTRIELRAQRPFTHGFSFLVAYAYNASGVQEWFDDIAQYQVLQSGGEEGWEWRPTDTARVHRVTGAVHLADPGRHASRRSWSDMPRRSTPCSAAGRYTAAAATTRAGRCCSTPATSSTATRRSSNPTRDTWFDTSMFAVQDLHAAQQPVLLRRAQRPERVRHRHDADQDVQR